MHKNSKLLAVLLSLSLCVQSWGVPFHKPQAWTVKPPPGTPIDWGNPLSKGLVGAWLFNEGSGAFVYDATHINASAPYTTPYTFSISKYGKSLAFSGTSATNFITIKANPRIATSQGPFSVFEIFYINTTPPANGSSLWKKDDGANGFQCFVTQTTLQIQCWDFTASSFPQFNTQSNTVALNTWADYVFTYGGPVGVANGTFYVNGILQTLSTNTAGSGASNDATIDLSLPDSSGSSNTPSGFIALFFFWNRVLTPNEATQLHLNPYAFFQAPGPSPWWMTSVQAAAVATTPPGSGWLLSLPTKIRGVSVKVMP